MGSGFSGICLGIRLKQAGIHSFTILEKEEQLGGTWRDNAYPGAACDVPSFSYCFSFHQKVDWSRKWAPQDEILDYMTECARTHGLLPHIRFGVEVAEAAFDGKSATWTVRSTDGKRWTAELLVSAVGQLNRPHHPSFPGLEQFAGTWFHSARWRHDHDLAGRRVAVVGTAASAVQIVPRIAPAVRRLHVFQRSPNWMLPKNDRAYTELEKALFRRVPGLARLYRWTIWARHEVGFPAFRGNRLLSRWATRRVMDHLQEQVPDPALRQALIPSYPVGAKRILLSDDYYPALQHDNVRLVTAPIERVEPDAVVTADGSRHQVDTIIFATGFESTSFLVPMRIVGTTGESIHEVWRDGAEAYLGMTVAGFPNFFMMYGPNTNLGHNSIIFMIECQARYIVDCTRRMIRDGLASLEVRRGAMEAFNARLRAELDRTVWADATSSWYKTPSGRITNNWSGTTIEYWWRTRRAALRDYHCVKASADRGRSSAFPSRRDRRSSTGA